MATKPISIDVYEIKTLIIDKCAAIAAYLSNTPPAYIDTGAVGDMVKRIGELELALKETIAALPKPAQVTSLDVDGRPFVKNAPN